MTGATARELAMRCRLRRSGRDWRGDCPGCGYAGAFVLTERNGRPVWWCASCGSGAHLTRAVLGPIDEPRRRRMAEPADPAERRSLPRAAAGGMVAERGGPCRVSWRESPARRLWREARPIDATPAARYLDGRGIPPDRFDTADLRWHPRCPHPSGANVPALVALVRDAVSGEPQAIHRTFLAVSAGEVAKAAIEPVRASLGPIGGGVVCLGSVAPGRPLIVGEGIESTTSAALLLDGAPWAALSAGNLARLALPPAAQDVVIAADADAVGERAAWEAATRWRSEGRSVRVAFPDRQGADFNDLIREGHHAAQRHG